MNGPAWNCRCPENEWDDEFSYMLCVGCVAIPGTLGEEFNGALKATFVLFSILEGQKLKW